MAATGLLHPNVVLHVWAFSPQLPGFGGFFNILSKSTHLLYLFWHQPAEESRWTRHWWGMGLTGAKSFPFHGAPTQPRWGCRGPLSLLPSRDLRVQPQPGSLSCFHMNQEPLVWQTADHNPARQLPEDLDNSGVSFDDLNNSFPTPNLLSTVGDQSIYWKLGQRADFCLSVSPL